MLKLNAKRLYFVRHGHTDWNNLHKFQGHTDIPLNERGRRDAEASAALISGWFASRGLEPAFSLAIASPLARAQETARIVLSILRAEGAGVPSPDSLMLDPGLMEQGYGLWEGLTLEEIKQRFPGSVERQFQNMMTFTADGGEPMEALCARVSASIARLPDEALFVGHFGTLYGLMLTLWPNALTSFPRIPQNAFFVLEGGRLLLVDSETPAVRDVTPS